MKLWKTYGKALVVITALTTLLLWTGAPCKTEAASQPTAPQPAPAEASWPRRYEANGHTILLYEPQVDSWENHAHIEFRAVIGMNRAAFDRFLPPREAQAWLPVPMRARRPRLNTSAGGFCEDSSLR